MSLFTGEYFRIYPGRDRDFQNWSMIAQLIGAFICTILTAWVCDYYDLTLGHYMTKAWICIATTIISIPCCVAIFFVQENFWLSMSGVFVEYLLSTCWGQPAIGILSSVVDADIRGTAIGVFFFLISIFSIIAPHGFVAIQNHYGLDPIEEPDEFGWLCVLCTCVPVILAVPCFYMAGVRYSWHRFNEAILCIDRFGDEAALEWEEVTKKRFYQRTGDPAERSVLSASVDWKLLRRERKMKRQQLQYVRDALAQGLLDAMRNAGAKDADPEEPLVRARTYVGVLGEPADAGDASGKIF